MSPIVHFEMPAKDKKRVAKFYASAFGWGMQVLGPEMKHYVLATTTPVDKNGMHKKKSAINGGFYQRGEFGKVPHLVISVDDLKKHIAIVKKSGGKILGEPMDIPGIGKYVSFQDTEDNRVGMLQPSR